MTERGQSFPLPRILISAAAMVFIVWGIGQAQSVLVSFLLSVFLAILATPPVLWLERKNVPVFAAVLLVVAAMIVFMLAVGAVVGTSINSFYEALPAYQTSIQEQVTAFRDLMTNHGVATPDKILMEYVNPGAIMNLTAGLFTRLGSVFSNIVLIVITVAFILLEASSFPIKLRAVLGDPLQVFPRFTAFVDNMKRYMVLKTMISLATGILVTLWLALLRVDFPILWGFLAFLLNYVPTLGSSIAAIPAVLLAYLQFGIERTVLAAAGYIIINLVLDYGVEKRLLGRKLGLSTLVVFLSLIFWGSLLGPIGAVLCVPLTLTLKTGFESHESTRWIAVLLGPENLTEAFPPGFRRADVFRKFESNLSKSVG